jgi:hypothetical protein
MTTRILRIAGIAIAVILVLLISAVAFLWSNPEITLTSERVSGWIESPVFFVKSEETPPEERPLVEFKIEKDGWKKRTLSFHFRPGCYSLRGETADQSMACIAKGNFAISFRLDRDTYVKLTSLDQLELEVRKARIVTGNDPVATAKKSEEPGKPLGFLRYLAPDFHWESIHIALDALELTGPGIDVTGTINSNEHQLVLDLSAVSPEWNAALGGVLLQKDELLVLSNSSFAFHTKNAGGEASFSLGGELSGTYSLTTAELDARFAAKWKNPTPDFEVLTAENGTLKLRGDQLDARATVKALLHGKTPLGRFPLVAADVSVALHPDETENHTEIDLDLTIEDYAYAGIRAHSDLAITLVPSKSEIKYRKGELRIESKDFGETIALFSKTSWAIPVPFNTFHGPVLFHTEPFVAGEDRTTLPFVLTTDLKSEEQALLTETKAEVSLSKKGYSLLGIRVDALLKKVQFRLPDYDPLAPVPSLTGDARIVRYTDTPKPEPSTSAPPAGQNNGSSLSLEISARAEPGSIVLLNRFFEPSLSAGLNLETRPDSESITGKVAVSTPFTIRYLNRNIQMEQFEVILKPSVTMNMLVSMDRAGYRIEAKLHSSGGRTQIALSSNPPLENDEIVSLILYGVPKNSISSEQTRSVGSAEAAMGSEALGLFSFWAFASTPIESVLYDPATQTYSAVVRLPGGVVASIGSTWENDRQLALSKSLGKNWAVSTELIKDSDGVDRGGTLLRWRKSY